MVCVRMARQCAGAGEDTAMTKWSDHQSVSSPRLTLVSIMQTDFGWANAPGLPAVCAKTAVSCVGVTQADIMVQNYCHRRLAVSR